MYGAKFEVQSSSSSRPRSSLRQSISLWTCTLASTESLLPVYLEMGVRRVVLREGVHRAVCGVDRAGRVPTYLDIGAAQQNTRDAFW